MTAPRFNPLIRVEKYVTQVGQLRSMGRTRTGDAIQTAVATINCLVYQEDEDQVQTNPAITKTVKNKAILPISIRSTVKQHDHLSTVVDRFGVVVLTDARIDKIVDYNHWRHELRFFVVWLDVDLD